MKTARFLPAQIWTITKARPGNAVYIRPEHSDRVVPVYLNDAEAHAVMVELSHVLVPRPLVHDLVLASIEALGGKLSHVEIFGIKNDSYQTRMVIVQQGREHRVDARPQDILCLSARTGCPVLVSEAVLRQTGVPVSLLGSQAVSSDSVPQTGPLTVEHYLMRELDKAVSAEDFERAARLRDRLRELEEQERGIAERE